MLFRQIADDKLAQYAYLIGCQQTGEAILVDPERDVDRYLEIAGREGLTVTAVAETHIHADFLSGARELAARVPGLRLYLSDEGDADWKYEWVKEGGHDVRRLRLLRHGDTFRVGKIEFRALHTPGHTPEHMSFLVTDHGGGASEPIGLLSGDFVFVGDLGRPDLLETAAGVQGVMKPSAKRLHGSVRQFLELPDFVQVWPAHGAGSACGKALGAIPTSTVGYERRFSPAIDAALRGEDGFVDFILSGQPEPPLYFARMKRLNKLGAPVLGGLPNPRRLEAGELATLAGRTDVFVLDTRLDRRAFFAGHLPGSLLAPLDRTFPTVAGSFVDPEKPLYLIVEEGQVEEAVRDLARIGFDRIEGYAVPAALAELADAGFPLAAIESIDFAELERRRSEGEPAILDVRGAAEHAAGHIPGAVQIAHTRLAAQLGRVPEGEVHVHCRSGARAAASAAFLARQGRKAVHVDGAFADWPALARAAAER
jgi:hydroxyacylglutathione hydrolase